jgi:DNA polymerase-3 subunit beta
MKFTVSSSELLKKLQSVSKVINPKNTLPILDNFLFEIKEEELSITASDTETTLVTSLTVDSVEGGGIIAIEAKRLTDILKEFPEQPLTFVIDEETLNVDILSEKGKFSVVGADGEEYPEAVVVDEDNSNSFTIQASDLHKGIIKTAFATSNDELRPVMTGIYIEIEEDKINFVASDGHKLVQYTNNSIKLDKEFSFILPKKPADLLKNLLVKNTGEVDIIAGEKNIELTFDNYKVNCRLTEGTFPNYKSVIPTNNANKLIIDRLDFYDTLKRVAVFANEASKLIKLSISENKMKVSAQDIDFSVSAYEVINCEYKGDEMEIGFKYEFLKDILNNTSSSDVVIELGSASSAALIFPIDNDIDNIKETMLIMPMMLDSE